MITTNKTNYAANADATKLIDAINREGFGNESCGICSNISANQMFCVKGKDVFLNGAWLFVLLQKDDITPWLKQLTPTMEMEEISGLRLLLYKL